MKANEIKTSQAPFFDKKMIFLISLIVLIDVLMMRWGSAQSLDVMLYYTGEEARTLLASFSELQLKAYFVNELFDLVLILTYTATLRLAFARLYPHWNWTARLLWALAAADLIETLTVIMILKLSVSQSALDWLGVFTFFKWIFATTNLLLVFIGLIKRSFGLWRSQATYS